LGSHLSHDPLREPDVPAGAANTVLDTERSQSYYPPDPNSLRDSAGDSDAATPQSDKAIRYANGG
jgi:hypothetical protein